MRPMRHSELPLHKGSPNGRRKLGTSLNNALEKGLDLAGLSKTKTGAGDKEKAYIIRQNGILKCLLFFVVLIVIGNVIIFSTYLEIKVERRDAIHSEALHRKLEHSAQLKLMSVHMQLQKALDNEVHETLRIEEYRSFMERVFGNLISEVDAVINTDARDISEEAKGKIQRSQRTAYDTAVTAIDELVKQFRGKSARAKKRLKDIALQVIEDIDEEEKEKQRFKERIHELGASDDFEYQDEIDDEELDEFGVRHETNDKGEKVDEDKSIVEADLERFYKKLVDTKFANVMPDIVGEWEKHLSKVIETLENDSQETDLKGLENYVREQLLTHVPDARPFDPQKDRSILDFFEAKIYEAKLAPYRQNLLDMHAGWKSGSLSPYQVLANIEKVANDENLYLIYEWLNGFDEDEEFYQES